MLCVLASSGWREILVRGGCLIQHLIEVAGLKRNGLFGVHDIIGMLSCGDNYLFDFQVRD